MLGLRKLLAAEPALYHAESSGSGSNSAAAAATALGPVEMVCAIPVFENPLCPFVATLTLVLVLFGNYFCRRVWENSA